MLQNISWGEYIIAVTVVGFLYYVVIIALYYRDEATRFIRREPSPVYPGIPSNLQKSPDQDQTLDMLESVVADLRGIMQKAGTEISKPELLEQLKQRLRNYPGLGHPVFRNAITKYIILHAEPTCGHAFTATELEREWDRLISDKQE